MIYTKQSTFTGDGGMYKQCTTEETAMRQRQIEECLMENMRRHTFQEISVSDLCKQLDISRNLFYRYYSSKEDALLGMIDHAMMDYGNYELPTRDQYVQHEIDVARFFSYCKEKKALMDALHRSDLHLKFLERIMYHTLEQEPGILTRMIPFMPDCSEERLLFVVSGVVMLVLNWYRKGYDKSVLEITRIAVQMLTVPAFEI